MAIVETDEFGTEADREDLDPDAAPARGEKVAEFVEEDDDGQHEQKRHDVADGRRAEISEKAQGLHARSFL